VSSILKALKKLEQDKVLRGERTVDLALDIHRGAQRRRAGSPFTIVLFVLLLVVVAAGAWVLMVPGGENRKPLSDGMAVRTSPQSVVVVSETIPVAQPAPPVDLPPVAREEPPVAKTQQINARPLAEPPTEPPANPQGKVISSASPVRHGARNQVRQFAGLKLTGIVWQSDASSRMAIIDDLPVMVGTVISGATVVEILSDRVVLSHDGQTFELLLEP